MKKGKWELVIRIVLEIGNVNDGGELSAIDHNSVEKSDIGAML